MEGSPGAWTTRVRVVSKLENKPMSVYESTVQGNCEVSETTDVWEDPVRNTTGTAISPARSISGAVIVTAKCSKTSTENTALIGTATGSKTTNHAPCDNCDAHMTEAYHRVFAANNGTLHVCSNCRIRPHCSTAPVSKRLPATGAD
ncbi:DUF7563 family protein [Haloterrigena turkmenica]